VNRLNYGLDFAIFDMDGTLVDSMPAWFSLGNDYLAEKSIEAPANMRDIVYELSLEETAIYFRGELGITDSTEKIVADMIAVMNKKYRGNIPQKPGAVEYLKALKTAGVRMCIATATEENLAGECLRRLGLLDYFEFVLSCENLKTSKRVADIYMMCAERFGAKPQEIALYEDALYAVRTAKNAGFFTVGVEDELSLGDTTEIKTLADVYIKGFGGLIK